jgi:hypothetical protein
MPTFFYKIEIVVDDDSVNFFAAIKNPNGVIPILETAMENVMRKYEEIASVYAPDNEANHPGRFSLRNHKPMGFYERGRGWWYPLVKTVVTGRPDVPIKMSQIHTKGLKLRIGKRAANVLPQVTGYHLSKTSEQMNTKWKTEVSVDQDIVSGHLTNSASYFPYVQGLEQAYIHEARDWQNVVKSYNSEPVQDVLKYETDKAIDSYYGLQ